MRQVVRFTLAAVLLGVTTPSAQSPAGLAQTRDPQTAAQPVGTASLSGTATIIVNGQPSPIRRARVTLQSATLSPRTTDTDTQGRFRFDRLVAGAYQIVVDKSGFVPIGRVPAVELKDGQAATANVMMQRGGVIAGRIVAGDGEPVIGITVSAVRLGFGPYGKKAVAVRQTTTDDLGRYRIHTLQPGEYYIEAAPDPLRMLSAQAAPGKTPKPTKSYFDGTLRLNDARAVTLAAEQELADMDFTVGSAVVSTVSGRVTTTSGKPPASYTMRLQRVGAPTGEVRCFLGRPGDTSASFQCPNVAPGDFWLLVFAHGTPDIGAEFSVTRLTVDGQDLPDVAVTTALGVPVNGQVAAEGGVALPPGARVAALETDYEVPSITPGTPATPPAIVGADGTVAFPGLIGPRLFRLVGFPDSWAISGVQLDGVDISDTPVAFTSERPAVLHLAFTDRTGSVTGTVLTAVGKPAAGQRVVVFLDDARRWAARSRFIKSVELGADGHYTIKGLLPGKYLVAVSDVLDDGAWEDPDVLARLRPTAAPIVVTAGSPVTLDWKLK
jgi:hypothetical protein